ncbi:PaaI family thioesterase [Thermodesulfobacteriota bacterium]
MRYNVTSKQQNSKKCLVCGLQNRFGLHTAFYVLENQDLLAIFTPREEHQSYPGRLHGGIISTILDETIGRAIMAHHDDGFWGVTIEISVRFRKPVPLDEELRVLGRITNQTKRFFEGTGELLLPGGTVAAEAHGKYMKLPLDKIADFDFDEQDWKVVPSQDDPEYIDV